MYNVSVTINHAVTDDDMATLVEMAGFGIAFWAYNAQWDDDTYTVWYEDIEGDPTTMTKRSASGQELADALAYIAQESNGYVGDYARSYLREGDAGHIDSELADAVVQQALFGRQIYG